MDRDGHVVRVADLGLVDRVVDELEDHVVEAREVVGVPDVHAGALADGLEALQQLDGVGGVGACSWGSVASRLDARRPRGARGALAPRASPGRPPRARATSAPAAPPSSAARTAAFAGSASKNSSTQPSERPASKSSAAKSGGSPGRACDGLHSASLTSATVRATSPEEASAASGRLPASRSRSSRCGPASEYPRRRSSGSSLWQAARSSSTDSPAAEYFDADVRGSASPAARAEAPELLLPGPSAALAVAAHRRSGRPRALRSRPRAPRRRRRPPRGGRARAERCAPSGPCRSAPGRRPPRASSPSTSRSRNRRRAAGLADQELPVLRRQEDRRGEGRRPRGTPRSSRRAELRGPPRATRRPSRRSAPARARGSGRRR